MARTIEPNVSGSTFFMRSVSIDGAEVVPSKPTLSVRVSEPSDGLLDDDLIPDSRIYVRPAAIVEAKLNTRISASRRYAVE